MNYHLGSVLIAQSVNEALKAMGYYNIHCYPSASENIMYIHMGASSPFVAVDARKFATWFVKKKPYYHELKSMIEAKHKQNISK